MDFGLLPPEVNSARMYAGPGSGSMMAAAAGWDGLAVELRSTAATYSSVISGLTATWQGPSSAAMAAAVAPYAAWMNTTAAQAEQAATQARAAVAAYETAFAATVPPPVVAANRSQLMSLVATNVFGQNTAAIATTEAQYAGMWAQDAAAMYAYAGQSAAASRVTPFTPPPKTTDPSGVARQAAAGGQATATAAGTNTQSTLSQAMMVTQQALTSLAAPAAAPAAVDPPSPISTLLSLLSSSSPLSTGALLFEAVGKGILPANDTIISIIMGLTIGARTLNDSAVALEPALLSGAGCGESLTGLSAGANGLGAASAVSAGVGRAGLVGALAVPPSWAAATPTVRLAAAALQGTSAAAAPAVSAQTAGVLGSQLALASLAGAALGGSAPCFISKTTTRIGRALSDKDSESQTPDKFKRALAEAAQKPESVQHWHTDKEHLDDLLDQLSKKPGLHAVHVAGTPKTTALKAKWG
ncbi:PPE family protein [Mycobacterium branderi]|uniref:Ribulose-phosphate 3-epimerase n=1 Tax=Mycobacterium branderi TaxID=43348 RepID=A0A7I7WFN2_9MYCO|nr:PPE family protein [Mycobacterium branderi]MCV7235072.1 PPE family protein [Mycobacterium branderi]ORA32592.1 hypothetical protein BST20_24660 [Mycobacterium branderi]BBZ15313.1 ribulose-phosphate 3-epimerase [Mycobacterium branderi]